MELRHGIPAAGFGAFIYERLQAMGQDPANPAYQEIYLKMTARNDFNALSEIPIHDWYRALGRSHTHVSL